LKVVFPSPGLSPGGERKGAAESAAKKDIKIFPALQGRGLRGGG